VFKEKLYSKFTLKSGHQWLLPVILATREAEIRRITVPSQLLVNSSQDPVSKIPNTKKDWSAGRW
jgi:hypothetical protein